MPGSLFRPCRPALAASASIGLATLLSAAAPLAAPGSPGLVPGRIAAVADGGPGLLGAGDPASDAPDAPVADAAMRGDVHAVRSLLADGADVNAAQGDGMTGLHWAAELGQGDLAVVLTDHGADPAAVTRLGDYTPLHIASRNAAVDVVAVLLAAGAEVGARTSTGDATPLHFAATAGSVAVVEALLAHGADPNAPESRWGQTPLMFAAARGRTEAALLLVDHGADLATTARVLDLPSRDEQDRAAQRSRNERLQALQAGGAVAQPREPGAGNAPVLPSEPAVSPTAELNEGQRDRPAQPISHAELVGGYGGLTALLLAVREGRTGTALALLDRGADIDQVSAGDRTSPLLMATINGHFDLAMALLERGADPKRASHAGATPLYTTLNTHWIPKSRHPQPTHATQQRVTYLELMTALLDAGADPNARLRMQLWFTTFGDDYLRVDRMGATPFWRAAYALDIPAMRLLVARGADPGIPTLKTPERRFRGGLGERNERESQGPDPSGLPPVPVGGPGVWPIHAASGVGYGEGFAANIHRHVPEGWVPAVRYLVEELGADVNARDHNGYTAVHHAAARGDNELILYLVEQGADVMAVSRRGQTTVDMANGPVQRITPFPETIALLESLGAINNHACVSC